MSGEEARVQRSRPYGVTFAVAIAVFVVVLVLYLQPALQDRSPIAFNTWVTIGNFVILLMLCLLVVWKFTLSTPVEETDAEVAAEAMPTAVEARRARPAEDEDDGVVEEVPRPVKAKPKRVVVKAVEPDEDGDVVPEGLVKIRDDVVEEEIEDLPRIVEYPPKESGGVYSDALIKVDKSLMLNLRTLIGKVCMQCDELDDCQQRVEGKLGKEVFLENFECKEGLKRELHKARKRRQAEEAKAAAAKELVKEKAEKDTEDGGPSKGSKTGSGSTAKPKPKTKPKAKPKTKPKAKGGTAKKASPKKD